MSEQQKRKQEFAKFMQEGHMHYINNIVGRPASQAEYATWLGISPQTLTRLVNAQSMPTVENLIPIADKLGPKAYDIAGMRRMMPDDPSLTEIVDKWPVLSKELQEVILRIVREQPSR